MYQRQIYCKNWFPDRAFYVTIADADIGSLKSLHILFDKYLDHILVKFEQNLSPSPSAIVRTEKKLSFRQKMVNYFWQSVDAILEDVFVTEKNYLMLKY